MDIKSLIPIDGIDELEKLVEEAATTPFGMFNPLIIGKIAYFLGEKAVLFYRERSFWNKWYKFVKEVAATDEDRENFINRLSENGEVQENAKRIIDCIERIETEKKAQYLANVSISFTKRYINISEYFRICDVIVHTLDEDLKFLAEHIKETDIKYSLEVHGLLRSGLINPNLEDEGYSFNTLAKFVDKYAINFKNRTRYPNIEEKPEIVEPPRAIVESDEEAKRWLDGIFDK